MNILLADDHVLFRDALEQFISVLQPSWSMTQVSSFHEALSILKEGKSHYDLVLLDYRMPGMNGLEGLKTLIRDFPQTKASIISGVIEEDLVREAMKLGSYAFFPKTLTGKTLIKAIELVLSGEKFLPLKDTGTQIMPAYFDDNPIKDPESEADKRIKQRRASIIDALTRREQEVIQYLAQGLSNKEIANELDLQIATIKLHVSGICKKMGADNRTKAALLAHQYGLINEASTLNA